MGGDKGEGKPVDRGDQVHKGDIKRGRNSAISRAPLPPPLRSRPFVQDVCKSRRCGSVHGAINVPVNAGYISPDKWWLRKKRSYLSSRIVSHPLCSLPAHSTPSTLISSIPPFSLRPPLLLLRPLNKFESKGVPRRIILFVKLAFDVSLSR